ncbi:MAG: MBOAT family O-acyltransferase [Deltaproteobacteria bacterium]|nr:MBOAT family O-acyltransferase [Deltaproteobacteria bacterium]
MSFVSLAFAVFFPVVLVLYHLLGARLRAQNALLLAASYLFYGWWDWRFLGLLLFTSLVDYAAARLMAERPARRGVALAVSLSMNLGVLFAFKYFDFFADSLNALLAQFGATPSFTLLHVILPVGISFYTFQSMAYTIDVYRGVVAAERDLPRFLTYVAFFPQLVAGPIERARHMLPQFARPRHVTLDGLRRGLWLIVWGYYLKIVLGDVSGAYADAAFRVDQTFGWSVILGTVAFGLQIYGDFSGYSAIAKGTAALLGFELMWNFDRPYWSLDVREFWQRWHISLSTWLRDYLYIPLGGNRRGRLRTMLNLFLTMVLGGLWHGAAWNFVLWGAWHGALLGVHRVYDAALPAQRRLPVPLAWALTTLAVFIGWFFFRARSWPMITGMTAALGNLTWTPGHGALLVALAVLIAPVALVEWLQARRGAWVVADAPVPVRVLWEAAALLVMVAVMDRVRAEFIYFQF